MNGQRTQNRGRAQFFLSFLLVLIMAEATTDCRAVISIDDLSFIDENAGTNNENCTDGLDNDGDGQLDCDDSDCTQAGYTCTDTHDALAVILELDKGCGSPFTAPGVVSCENACACQANDGPCPLNVNAYAAVDCSTPLGGFSANASMCFNTDTASKSVILKSAPLAPAQCSPINQNEAPTDIQGCKIPTTGHCTGGGACIPPSPKPECLLFDGNVACPAEYGTQQSVFPKNVPGSCECSCSTTDMGCTAPTLVLYDVNNNCAGGSTALTGSLDTCLSASNTIESVQIELGQRAISCNSGSYLPPDAPAALQTLCCGKN